MKSTLEIEKLILGALLAFEQPARALDASGLTPGDFTDSAMRTAFDLARRRIERRLPAHAVEVWGTGCKTNKFQGDDLGWLNTLQATNALDEKAFHRLAEDLRTQVRTRGAAARLRELANEVERQNLTLTALGTNLDTMSHQLARSYQANRTAENDPVEVVDRWERNVKEGKTHQVKSGVPLFDELTGGWVPNLNLVVGKPSIGKSAFAASAIEGQLDAGQRPAIFGLEDGHIWISRRIIARDNGLPVRAVGSKPLTPEEWVKVGDNAAKLSQKMKNLLVYKWSGSTSAELVRYAKAWIINEGVTSIWLDNATSVRHGGHGGGSRFHQGRENDFRIQVAQSVEAFKDLAEHYGVPVIILCHTTREYEEKRGYSAPELTDVSEGAAYERFARMFVGCWAKQWSNEFRITVKKNIEGAPNITMGFDRHLEQALIDVRSGRAIDLRNEAKKERQEKKEKKREEDAVESVLRAEVKKKVIESKKASEAAPPAAATEEKKPDAPPPQLSLLEPSPVDAKPPEEPKP